MSIMMNMKQTYAFDYFLFLICLLAFKYIYFLLFFYYQKKKTSKNGKQ